MRIRGTPRRHPAQIGAGPDHPRPGAAGPTPAAARRADTGLETGPTVGARYSRRESAPGPPPATVGWSARPPPPRWRSEERRVGKSVDLGGRRRMRKKKGRGEE